MFFDFHSFILVFLHKREEMAAHNELGRQGEDTAAFYLEEQGYHIRHRNWRNKHKELDIVAEKDGELIIAEVKTRTSSAYGTPEEAVTPGKIRRLVHAANAYVQQYELDMPLRFDILSLTGENGHFQLTHYPEAFHSPIW